MFLIELNVMRSLGELGKKVHKIMRRGPWVVYPSRHGLSGKP